MLGLIQLTETDKRVLMALLFLLIIAFVLIGFLGALVQRVMKWQGKQIDDLCHDVVVTKVITDKKHFKKYARKKNWKTFYKESWIPLIILTVSGLVFLITCLLRHDFSYNIFDYEKTGFPTLFFIWDFSDCYEYFFGIKLLARWPSTLINSPHFSVDAIGSYIFVPTFLTGAIWYLITIQRLIARTLRINKLCDSVFSKSLEGYNQNTDTVNNNSSNGNSQQIAVKIIKMSDFAHFLTAVIISYTTQAIIKISNTMRRANSLVEDFLFCSNSSGVNS